MAETESISFPELDHSFLLDPFPFYAKMRRESPVATLQSGAYIAFGYEDVKRVLTDYATFSSKIPTPPEQENFTQSVNFIDPPKHKSIRSLVQQAFTHKRVEDMAPRITELVHELIDDAEGRNKMDFLAGFAAPLPVTVIAEILGVPVEDRDAFKRWSDSVVLGDQAALHDLASYVRGLIEERAGNNRGDLISDLVVAHEVDGTVLSEQELVDFCILLLVAGNETTTNLIASMVRSLDEHPEALERLRADRSLIPSAIEETLRYRSPVQIMQRYTVQEVELNGVRVPAGQLVLAHLGSANRDAASFENSEAFWIDRAPNRHLAFGQGVHFCLGAPLARLEARIALDALLERLPNLRVDPNTKLEPIPSEGIHGVTMLPVLF